MDMINFENILGKLYNIISTENWKKVSELFKTKDIIFMFGHGGNMAVCDHLAMDIARLTTKNVLVPSSGITVTSLLSANEGDWIKKWLEISTRGIDPEKCMTIACSCSLNTVSNKTIINALEYSYELNIQPILFSAKSNKEYISSNIIEINSDSIYYHTAEVLNMMLFYQLIYTYTDGVCPPPITVKSNNRLNEPIRCNICMDDAYDHSFCDNYTINFDGVIHNFNEDMVEETKEALKKISKKYNIVIYSEKDKQLMIEWLTKYNILQYITNITYQLPQDTKYYIDVKDDKFNWSDI